LWVWGKNNQGQLCDNTTTNRSSPIQTITFGTNWMQVSCGNSTTAAIKTDGSMWSWGLGTSGQLGDNTILSKSSPVQTVAFGTNWKQVSGGYKHMAAVTNGDI
jgi:alpha-tubulin suppressor-like RCC1 family protein